MSTSERINDLKDAMLSVTDSVYHRVAHKAKAPYIVWAEEGAGSALRANGKTVEQPISGTVDLYEQTASEERLFDAVQNALNSIPCAWALNSIQTETETGLTHYEWTWEVC